MIQTGCCEIMDIFEVAIGTIKGASNGIVKMKVEVEDDIMLSELKENFRTVWIDGAKHFSFLLVDKLWKEDRLCSKCEVIYHKLQGGVKESYSVK